MRRSNRLKLFTLLSLIGFVTPFYPATAIDLNYESLSSLEEPLAFDYADITFSLTGLADSGFTYDFDTSDNDSSLLGNFQIGAETQLPNSWTLGAAYFAEYSDAQDDYIDNAAVFLSGIWGVALVGNVTSTVREETRRNRGIGNAVLEFDDHLGRLDDTGIAYIGRFGPTQLIATLDNENGYEIGGTYQRPIDNKDYRFSLRYRDSEFTPGEELVSFDSKGLGFVAELTYGSTVFDLGLGVEELSTSNGRQFGNVANLEMRADRQFLSLGAAHKIGTFTISGEAHFGDIEGQSERSFAAGMKYDLARGLSLNFGMNYNDAQVELNGISVLNADSIRGTASLRYSF